MNINELKQKYKNCLEEVSNLKQMYHPQICHNCKGHIQPGDETVVIPTSTEDKIYCSAECFIDDNNGYTLNYFSEDRDDYISWFNKKT